MKDETKFSKVLPETIKNKEFNTANEAVEYIKHLDMRLVLGLKSQHNCIFHSENHPSASIYKGKNGIYRYKCHSTKCVSNKNMDVIELIERLQGVDFNQALDFLISALNLTIKNRRFLTNDEIHLKIEETKGFVTYITGRHPEIIKVIGSRINVLFALYEIAEEKENISDTHGILLGASNAEIRSRMEKTMKISNALAVLALFGFIRRLQNYEIYNDRLGKLIRFKRMNKGDAIINQTLIKLICKEEYAQEEQKIIDALKNWQENRYVAHEITYKKVQAQEGVFRANELFPNYL